MSEIREGIATAKLEVTGRLWRSVYTPEFHLDFDSLKPELVSPAEWKEKESVSLFLDEKEDKKRIQIMASERLDKSNCECKVDGDLAVPFIDSSEPNSLAFDLPDGRGSGPPRGAR